MCLFRPHGVGLLDLVDDVLLNDMLLEVREHLCVGQHCVDVFHECCLWIWRLVEGHGAHLVDGKFALVEQLLVVDRWELHEIQVICICGSGMVGQLLCPTIAVWRCGGCHLSDEALCGWAEPLVGVVNSASGPWSILGAASGNKGICPAWSVWPSWSNVMLWWQSCTLCFDRCNVDGGSGAPPPGSLAGVLCCLCDWCNPIGHCCGRLPCGWSWFSPTRQRLSPTVGVVVAPRSKDLCLLVWRGIPGGPKGPSGFPLGEFGCDSMIASRRLLYVVERCVWRPCWECARLVCTPCGSTVAIRVESTVMHLCLRPPWWVVTWSTVRSRCPIGAGWWHGPGGMAELGGVARYTLVGCTRDLREGSKFTFGHGHARWFWFKAFCLFCCLLVWGDISSRV